MVTVLITSFLLLAAIIYVVYRRQERLPDRRAQQDRVLPPPSSDWNGLFGEETAREQKQLEQAARAAGAERRRAEIWARASGGERSVLVEARSFDDPAFYDEVLNRVLEQADSEKKLLALVSYMLRETPPLSVNRRLAERVIEDWKASPDRGSTARMLHITALADDAGLYRQAVETALEFWLENRIAKLSAEELRQLCESEYWILSQNERGSGEGFLLKLKLAALRRELARGANIGGGG